MTISKVNLGNSDQFKRKESERSVAFFCRVYPIQMGRDLIEQLKAMAQKAQGKNVRLCFHSSPRDTFHEMLIYEWQGKYYRPHKHLRKGESFHIYEGKMAVFVFDERGSVLDATVLSPDDVFFYRMGIGVYHAVMPLTEYVIYHEAKPGPFLGEEESLFPDWAPDSSDPKQVDRFLHELRRLVTGNI